MRKAFISPTKYVQGENEIVNLGYFIKTFGDSALLIAHQDDITRVKDKLKQTMEKFGVTIIVSGFNGECSRNEVHRLQQLAKEHACSCTIGLGGGKAIDTAKCVAEGEALIIVPTIAATDAPTSHSAVLYTPEGEFDDYAYFKQSPSVVLIDTNVIANAPTRFLVAGMGDALSTYFEARATANSYSNVNAGLPCGANAGVGQPTKGTRAALALAKLCYETLLEDGLKAKISCDSNIVTPALENIIETNILLSGLGFESGGLAAAHAIHNGLTALEGTHSYYHGEKVAFSTLVQIVLENTNTEEINEVLNFCVSVGLPVCLADIGVTNVTRAELHNVAQKACIIEESIHSMPFPMSEEDVVAAIIVADQIGQEFKKKGE
ncbi:glycerol dehydrogenase [Brevibacillus laterosporus]|uniref:glycerol dehydrogenase n=1 Tax=Brevibacillus laterosporus TaxID=1465 RepID=UPI0014448863|nr:glycerol dehydrogenase [Brevibacillus laterosporus]NKQ20733.1 glycerol dehydrogenase [Brevibacillus laterosporus]WNX29658.1 glycerol dehydrogenase [Brevibacillus laterosporus]